MEKTNRNIGIILLAAGASKRLGRPKQMLCFRGESLLARAAGVAVASGCRPAIVVLGANATDFQPEIEKSPVEIVANPNWRDGMGTSIEIGLKRLLEISPNAAGAVLMVCDQPFVTVDLIERLTRIFRLTNAPIVASAYRRTIGVPAFFSRGLFPELMKLKVDEGAKKIIFRHREIVVEVPFEAGAYDIDTEQDYRNLAEKDEKDFKE